MNGIGSLWPRLYAAREANGPGHGSTVRVPSEPFAADSETTRSVVVASDAEQLQPYMAMWEELVAHATEPNLFYEPWMLLPAMRYLTDGSPVQVAMVLERTGESCRMLGLFPLSLFQSFRGLPVRTVRMWCHRHCYLTSPLVWRGQEAACWRALFKWLGAWSDGGELLDLGILASDGELAATLSDYIQGARLPIHVAETYTRALLVRKQAGDVYIKECLSQTLRHALARKRRRLAEQGAVCTRSLAEGEDIEPWLDEFLRLESGGWKGRAGTAVTQRAEDTDCFRETMREAHRRGRLLMLKLELDGKPIAMQINMTSGEGAFGLKVAYDERWKAYSPGVLLELEGIHALHSQPGLRWADSCSAATNIVMKRLWKQRRSIVHLIVPTGRRGSALLVSLIPLGRYLRHALRSIFRLKTPSSEEEYV